MQAEFHIASLVVHCLPERRESIFNTLVKMSGAEVHGQSDDGKLVVTVEGDNRHEVQDGLETISNMDGVMSATLAYHRVEPLNLQE